MTVNLILIHLKLANHKYDAHLNSLAVYLENGKK